MSKPAIRVDGISKAYHIGLREAHRQNFREALAGAAAAPWRRLRRLRGEPADGASTFWALHDVSFTVAPGEVVGIIGRNGAGKSTLLKILSRITEPTRGEIRLRGRVASLLEVGTGFHPELTGRENIYLNGAILGMRRTEIQRKFDEIVAFSEVEKFLDTPVKHYSSGMYVRLAFAVAAHLEPEILIVDEVLAVGDAEFQKKCLGKMQEVAQGQGRTVLFVSHNMGAVRRLCTRGILLNKGRVETDAPAEEAVACYAHGMVAMEGEDTRPAHVLYQEPAGARMGDFAITRVELCDRSGRPLAQVHTWDEVVFRFTFRSTRSVNKGSVALEISTFEGARLLLLSTQPDSTLPLRFEPGEQVVECVVDRLPLTAGEYVFGAGLAVPGVEWLWHQGELARLKVEPRDVYGSGLAPDTARALLAVEHSWRSGT